MCSVYCSALKYFLIFIIWAWSAYSAFTGTEMIANLLHEFLHHVSQYMLMFALSFGGIILVLHAIFHTKLLVLYFDKDKDNPPFYLNEKWIKFFIFFHTMIFLLSMLMLCSANTKCIIAGVLYMIYSLAMLIIFIFNDRRKINAVTKFLSYLTFYPLMVMVFVGLVALVIYGADSIFHFLLR